MTEIIGHGPEEIQNLLVISGAQQSQMSSTEQSQTQKSKKPAHIILPRLQFMDVEVADTPVGKNSKLKKSPISPFQQELDTYSALPYSSSEPEAWWQLHRKDYPGLFYCAMRILNIPGSSVPSESLFSEAGDQVTKKRNRLDPERVNKMMVVEEFYS